MPSLQRRLLLGTALGTSSILILAGAALYAMTRASLLHEFDQALIAKAKTLAAMVEQDAERVELEFTQADMPEFQRADHPEYFQVWLADATVVERSISLNGLDLPRTAASRDSPVLQSMILPDGSAGRVVTVLSHTRVEDESSVVPLLFALSLARNVLDVNATLANLRLFLLVVGVAATLGSLGVLTWLIRVGLKPVEHLATQIAAIDEHRLGVCIDPANAPRELRPVVSRLNEALHRLDAAFEREKTMTANVAHELRTPLAGLRSTLEVALSRERDSHAYRRAMTDCQRICLDMQRLVENLLILARLEAEPVGINRQPTPIEPLLRAGWAPFEAAAAEKQLRVQWELTPKLAANTDADKLRPVLSNLFENAVNYADSSGSVCVRAEQLNGGVHIRVSNSGSELSAEDLTRVFDRFWRADQARHANGTHCGLGLALCKTLIERLGGRISAASPRDGWFEISVTV